MKRAMYYKELEETEDKKKLMKIYVSYSKGGMNYMSGNVNRRGIYVHFTQVERTINSDYSIESSMPFDNSSFKILALELKRASQKKIDAINNIIADMQDTLFKNYKKMNKDVLYYLVSNIES